MAFRNLPTSGAVSPNVQVDAALAAFPGAQVHSYRLPDQPGDAALIHLGLGDGVAMRDVFVSPQGKVLGSLDPDWRIAALAHDIHGQLLLGSRGSWIVELAASWAIVMIISGLYLWWPKDRRGGRGLGGIVWPRLGAGPRVMLRDLHAVTGFWVAGLTLILLLTGLPWADVWGSAFKAVRTEMGWVKGRQDWTIGGRLADGGEHAMHAEHDHAAMMRAMALPAAAASLGDIVAKVKADHLAFPVLVIPPGAPQRFGGPSSMTWTVKSDTQDRPRRVTIRYDMTTGREVSRETFADKHPIDRVVGYGVAWHEGALFGVANQLIGLATALALITLSVSGFLLWRRRKPASGLGPPPASASPARWRAVAAITMVLASFLPLLALSLATVWLAEWLVLRRSRAMSAWLGLDASRASRS